MTKPRWLRRKIWVPRTANLGTAPGSGTTTHFVCWYDPPVGRVRGAAMGCTTYEGVRDGHRGRCEVGWYLVAGWSTGCGRGWRGRRGKFIFAAPAAGDRDRSRRGGGAWTDSPRRVGGRHA